jgi:hypothetical protein
MIYLLLFLLISIYGFRDCKHMVFVMIPMILQVGFEDLSSFFVTSWQGRLML